MKKPELLAPVGNYECLKAAIEAGCDAVYLAGKHYGARNFANNFTDDELVDAIKYAHLYGVKVYVTINTLIYDAEVKHFIDYVRFLHQNNVDAIIIQDLGMLSLISHKFPNLEIHASTQMHVHNVEGIRLMKKLGVKRAVIARETSIDLLKEMQKEELDLEVFIHGALCMCYSGQCLMSSLIGGRSGNRGTCAQCCRQPYNLLSNDKIINKNKYLLSTKDLNTSAYIGELIDLGIKSLKIEGRMKRPEYVYQVVSFYREIIDNYIKTKEIKITSLKIKDLKKIFNREFTKGFLFNEENDLYTNEERPNHLGIVIGKVISYKKPFVSIKLEDDLRIGDGIRIVSKEDIGFNITSMFIDGKKVLEAFKNNIVSLKIDDVVEVGNIVLKTSDIKQLKSISELINKSQRKVYIEGKITFKNNKLYLLISDGINEAEAISPDIELSKTAPTGVDTVKKQISKLGDSVYLFNKLEVDMPDNLFIPIKIINEMRRNAIDILNKKRLYSIPFKELSYKLDVPNFDSVQEKCILINSIDDYEKIKNDNYDEIYISDYDVYNSLNIKNKVLKLPRVIEKHNEYDVKLLVGEVGSINKYNNIYTDFSLNVTNAYTVGLLHHLGVKKITLSYELNDNQIKKLVDNYKNIYGKNPNLEIIVEANEEVMISKYNILDKYRLDNSENYLVDRFNNKYYVTSLNGFMVIYNYKRRKLDGNNYYKMGINSIRINMKK